MRIVVSAPSSVARVLSASVLALSAVATGCGLVVPSNPFDPATPAEQQAKATLFGRVALDRDFDDDDDRVSLVVVADDGGALDAVVATRIDGAAGVDGVGGDVGGTFSVDVPPGTWSLQFDASDNGAFDVDDAVAGPVTVAAGQRLRLDVKPAPLSPDALGGAVRGTVAGGAGGTVVVRLRSDVDGGHEDVAVVAGGAYAFDAVPAGAYRVEVSAAGFLPVVSGVVTVGDTAVDVAAIDLVAVADVVSLEEALVDDRVTVVFAASLADRVVRVVDAAGGEGDFVAVPANGRVDVDVGGAADGPGAVVVEVGPAGADGVGSDAGTALTSGPLTLPFVKDSAAPVVDAVVCVDCFSVVDDVAHRGGGSALIDVAARDASGIDVVAVTVCAGDVCDSVEGSAPVVVPLVGGARHRLGVVAIDPLGHRSPVTQLELVSDDVDPVVVARVNGGATVTNAPLVQVTIDASGEAATASPLTGLRVTTSNDIATRPFVTFAASFAEVLAGADVDGEREFVIDVRDAAGNVTRVTPAPRITLDRARPALQALSINAGATVTNDVDVDVVVRSSDADAAALVVELSGDLAVSPVRLPFTDLPTTLSLSPGEGAKTVTAVAVDAAGNASAPVSAGIVVDTTAPAAGVVVLAGGQATVQTQTLAVDIRDTAADAMLFREAVDVGGVGGACDVPACGDAAYGPFSSATTFTLRGEEGAHEVCWRFCDAAGNGSDVGRASVVLGTFIDRPRPSLASLSPSSIVAFSNESGAAPRYPLALLGQGIARDTQAVIGDFTLPCVSDAGACADDDAGDSGCADACVVDLPDEIVRSAGTYVVRLFTPAPVTQGLSTSPETRLLSIVAPLPVIELVEPRGVVQDVDDEGQPVAQIVDVTVRGRGLMDNVQARLGGNFGEIVAFDRDDDDAALVSLVARVSTADLFPSDDVDVDLALSNPSPGGGETVTDFGVTPRLSACLSGQPCVSNLRRSRPLTADGAARVQGYLFDGALVTGVTVNGGDAVQLLDAAGNSLGRYRGDGAQPSLPLGQLFAVAVEDRRHAGPPVFLQPATARTGARFVEGVGRPAIGINSPAAFAVTQLDVRENAPDVLLLNNAAGSLSVYVNGNARLDFPMGSGVVSGLAVGDVNSDGAVDVVVGARDENAVSLRFGDGRGGLLGRIAVAAGTSTTPRTAVRPAAVALADIDDDNDLDLVAAGDRVLAIRRGAGDGRFSAEELLTLPLSALHIEAADLDNDGAVDLVVGNDASAVTLLNDGGGSFGAPRATTAIAGRQRIVDVDNDGIVDVISGVNSSSTRCALGDGTGGFTLRTSINNVALIGAADLSGDGVVDLVTSNFSVVSLRAGDGTGSFAAPTTVLTPTAFVLSAALFDATGDGALDIVGVHFVPPANFSTQVIVSANVGGPTLGATTVLADAGGEHGGTVADFNRDGRPDVVNGKSVNLLRVAQGNGDGTFQTSTTIAIANGNNNIHPGVGDFNGDGLTDLMSVSRGGDRVGFHSGNGAGGFAAVVNVAVIDQVNALDIVDLDGDGVFDGLISSNPATQLVRGRGDGSFDAIRTLLPGFHNTAAGDVNSDGLLDLVEVNNAAGALVHLATAPAVFAAPVVVCASCNSFGRPILLDLDADGRLDFAISNDSSGRVLRGDGRGGFSAPETLSGPVQAAGDFDGDGQSDVVIGGFGTVAAVLPAGRGPQIPVEGAFRVVSTDVDVNADGAVDLVSSGNNNELMVHLMPSGAATAQEHTLAPAPTPLPPGTSTFALSTAPQRVDRLAVRLRIVGSGLGALSASLTSPSGRTVLLDDGAAFANLPVWQASYPTKAPLQALSTLLRSEPAGDWLLTIDNDGSALAVLEDFTVETVGAMVQLPLGSDPKRPSTLALPSGARGGVVFDTTLGRRDNASTSCAASPAGDAWYELTLPLANTATVTVTSAFDAVVEVSRGRCEQRVVTACNDNAVGRSPRVSNIALTAGTHCVHVDGRAGHSGNFQLSVRLSNALP